MSEAARTGQLPLALRFPPDQRLDSFVCADAAVVAAIERLAMPASAPADAPRAVFVAGAAGSGKTHLAIAACVQAGADGLDAAYLPLAGAAARLREALEGLHRHDLIALDGVEAIAGEREAEIALFDFHNRAQDAGRRLLYTARARPDALGLVLPDLRSRLSQCLRIALAPLDDAGRARLLRLRAQRRGLQIDQAAIDWLLRRVGRDLAGLTALFDRLDRAALAAQRRITVPFLRQVLGERP